MEIVFSDRAAEMIVSVALFIEQKWSLRKSEQFLTKAHKTFELISKHPYMFKGSSLDETIRVGIITKQCSFFYQVNEKEIVILFLWDNRQEPNFT